VKVLCARVALIRSRDRAKRETASRRGEWNASSKNRGQSGAAQVTPDIACFVGIGWPVSTGLFAQFSALPSTMWSAAGDGRVSHLVSVLRQTGVKSAR
jgi:hypothetical protein